MHYDGTVTFGNIVLLIVFLVGFAANWTHMREQLEEIQKRLGIKPVAKAHEGEVVVTKNDLALSFGEFKEGMFRTFVTKTECQIHMDSVKDQR